MEEVDDVHSPAAIKELVTNSSAPPMVEANDAVTAIAPSRLSAAQIFARHTEAVVGALLMAVKSRHNLRPSSV